MHFDAKVLIKPIGTYEYNNIGLLKILSAIDSAPLPFEITKLQNLAKPISKSSLQYLNP